VLFENPPLAADEATDSPGDNQGDGDAVGGNDPSQPVMLPTALVSAVL